MAGSEVVSSWASSIVGDLPPPKKIQQLPQEEQQHQNAHNQVNVSMPPFTGRFKPDLYIEWEFEINAIFASHNFSERRKLRSWLVHSLVVLLFGRVNIVVYTLIMYLIFGMI